MWYPQIREALLEDNLMVLDLINIVTGYVFIHTTKAKPAQWLHYSRWMHELHTQW